MRRGLLQDYANTLRDIAEGWRIFNDLDLLLELGSGTIEIDVLRDAAAFDGEPLADLASAGELSTWLSERMELDRCPPGEIVSAMVAIEFTSSSSPPNPFTLRSRCSASVRTLGAVFDAPPSR